jgi:hypothetical protein
MAEPRAAAGETGGKQGERNRREPQVSEQAPNPPFEAVCAKPAAGGQNDRIGGFGQE